jgi:hypothetical protein
MVNLNLETVHIIKERQMKVRLYQQGLLTFCAVVFGLVVPILEINPTHVFNPAWPAHARLHEVWQLATNSLIALYCLRKIWLESKLAEAALLTLIVTSGFFIAWLTQASYGGSMLHADGTQPLLWGINIGVLGFGIVWGIAALIWFTERRKVS